MTKFIFGVQINIEVFYKLKASLQVLVARLNQSTQNKKFVISLQYLKLKVKDEADFLPVEKLHTFRIDTIILPYCLQYIKKEVSDEADFLYADKQVGIMVFDGSGQICLKYPKYLYCEAKY